MLTICWAAKGGSGTTVYAAAKALMSPQPALLVDLAGDLPNALGLPAPDGPGVHDWLRSSAPAERLHRLEHQVTDNLSIIAAGNGSGAADEARWIALANHLRADDRAVVVDAGTGRPPGALVAEAHHSLLVTRACYLAIRNAAALQLAPTGVVLIEEPGRALTRDHVEVSIGAPIVATALLDPAIARAVDAGLLVSRLPAAWRRQLRKAA